VRRGGKSWRGGRGGEVGLGGRETGDLSLVEKNVTKLYIYCLIKIIIREIKDLLKKRALQRYGKCAVLSPFTGPSPAGL
jgi:hypothetical protein